MFTTKGERIITQLVDQFLDRSWYDKEFQDKRENWSIQRKKGLVFNPRFRVDQYTDDGNEFATDQAIIMFTGNTSVFYVIESQVQEIFHRGEYLVQELELELKNNKHLKFDLDKRIRYAKKLLKTKPEEMPFFDPVTIPYDWWINSSNHDSCWRSDGLNFINKIYWRLCKEVNSDVAPASLDDDIDFGFGKVFEDIIIHTIADPEEDSSYWRQIVNVERIPQKQ